MSKSRAMLLFGTEEVPAPLTTLRAGPLSVELQAGNLRYVRWHGREVLRAIAFIVRDSKWGTYAPLISGLAVDQRNDGFSVRYEAGCDGSEGDIAYRASIEGGADGRLRFSAEGKSGSGFSTNRTGFVVLHPLEGVVGHEVEVEHASGGRSTSAFPVLLSPGQPVFDIRTLSHEPEPGMRVTVRMEGDAYEMEDHRNWTDASFKTYVRPLALPFPYRIEAGEELAQSISIELSGGGIGAAGAAGEARVDLGGEGGPMPRVGLALTDRIVPDAALRRAAGLSPGFVTGRIDLRTEDAGAALRELGAAAATIGARLALEAVIAGVAPEAELRPLATALEAGVQPESLFVIPARDLKMRASNNTPTGQATSVEILTTARRMFPGLRLGGGVPIGFTELNRNRPPAGIDFVTHATQAIVHAADDISVMETLEALPHVVTSVRAIAGSVPYRIGPASIGQPPSAAPSNTTRNTEQKRITQVEDDPRQRGLFAAAFAIGHAAASQGADELVLGAPSGDIGLFEDDGPPRPVAAAVKWLSEAAEAMRLETAVDGTSQIAAVAYGGPDGRVLLLANLASDETTVRLPSGFSKLELLDATVLAVTTAPVKRDVGGSVTLDAYAICRVS